MSVCTEVVFPVQRLSLPVFFCCVFFSVVSCSVKKACRLRDILCEVLSRVRYSVVMCPQVNSNITYITRKIVCRPCFVVWIFPPRDRAGVSGTKSRHGGTVAHSTEQAWSYDTMSVPVVVRRYTRKKFHVAEITSFDHTPGTACLVFFIWFSFFFHFCPALIKHDPLCQCRHNTSSMK